MGLLDGGNRRDARKAAGIVEDAKAHTNQISEDLRQQIWRLEDDLARSLLVIKSLVVACENAGVFTREELLKFREQIDASDGKVDGKLVLNAEKKTCPSCKRTSHARAEACIWCGTTLPIPDLLDG